jgi:peptidoglycan/xylan/chitin deacetylase (PgdA/CDA1 family)
LREGIRLPPNALAVTVDDGNQNFFLNGYPVFRAHQIPVTVFLVSGFLDRQLWLWWDQIRYVLEKSPRSSFQLSLSSGQPPVTFTIETAEQRQHAISTITEAMKTLSKAERHQALNEGLFQLLGVELPMEPPHHMAPMQWSEVRQMAENGVDVGAHTVSHPMLSRVQDLQELFHEIEHCQRRIEEELSRPVVHFGYPYGHQEDFNDETLKVLEQCKFQTAVTTQHGLNFRKMNPFLLKRLSVDAMLPEFYFQERLAGLHSG